MNLEKLLGQITILTGTEALMAIRESERSCVTEGHDITFNKFNEPSCDSCQIEL